jgi:hypothetical protein
VTLVIGGQQNARISNVTVLSEIVLQLLNDGVARHGRLCNTSGTDPTFPSPFINSQSGLAIALQHKLA